MWVVAKDDQHLGGRIRTHAEGLTERGRRCCRERRENAVVLGDLLGERPPATRQGTQRMFGCGERRIDSRRPEACAALEERMVRKVLEGIAKSGGGVHQNL